MATFDPNYLCSGFSWNLSGERDPDTGLYYPILGTPVTLSWSVLPFVPAYYTAHDVNILAGATFADFTDGFVAPYSAVDLSFVQSFNQARHAWAAVSGITWQPDETVVDFPQGPYGQVTFGFSNIPDEGFAPFPNIHTIPGSALSEGVGGDVWLNRSFLAYANANFPDRARGDHIFHTTLHELGHALGLAHDGVTAVIFSPATALPAGEANFLHTVMSYAPDPASGPRPITPMLYDVAAIQELYGWSESANGGVSDAGGNTLWAFTDGSHPFSALDMGVYNSPSRVVMTLWDPAGDDDAIDASGVTSDVTIDLNPGEFSAIGTSGGAFNVAIAFNAFVEDAVGGSGNDLLIGNVSANALDGGAGDDILRGGDDGDALAGGDGDDRLFGDDGEDVLDGGAGMDALTGGAENDFLMGGSDADALVGEAGMDELHGEDGSDALDGGDDDDRLFGGEGNDVLLGGGGMDALTGGAGDDILRGGDGDDALVGETGDDELYGEDGWDLLDGGDDDDRLFGGEGNDLLLGGGGMDALTGGTGEDILRGGDGDDALVGEGGHDELYGEDGSDVLDGGADFDSYFHYSGGGADIIIDEAGDGRIVFDGTELTEGRRRPGETPYTSRDGRFSYAWDGGDLVINDGALTVSSWQAGQLGIELSEIEASPTTINEQNAGFFSKAAYAPVGAAGDLLLPDYLDARWDDIGAYSAGGSQFRVFVNHDEREVVFAFKGADSFADLKDALPDGGASRYAQVHDLAEATLIALEPEYGGYEFFADGHGLGGAMAQSFALEFGLDGFAQNSLSVIGSHLPGELAAYAVDNRFIETNVAGDAVSHEGLHLDAAPTILPSVYPANELLGYLLLYTGGGYTFASFGLPLIGSSIWGAHKIDTVNDLATLYTLGSDGRLEVPQDGLAEYDLSAYLANYAQIEDFGGEQYIRQTEGGEWLIEPSVDPAARFGIFVPEDAATIEVTRTGVDTFTAEMVYGPYALGSAMFNEDHTSSITTDRLDDGFHVTEYFGADLFRESEIWHDDDGSHGSSAWERDGSFHIETYNADDSWTKEHFVAATGIYTSESLDAEETHVFHTRYSDNSTHNESFYADGSRTIDDLYADLSTRNEAFYADGSHSLSTFSHGSYTNFFEEPDGWFEESYDASTRQYLNSYASTDGIFHGSAVRNDDGSSHSESFYAGGAFDIWDTGADGSSSLIWRDSDGSHGDRTVQADGAFVDNHHFADGSYQTWVQEANGDFQAEVHDADGRLQEEMWRSGMDNPALVETGRNIYYPDGRFHSEVRKPFEGWTIKDGQIEEDGSYTAHTISEFGGVGDEAYDGETGGLTTRYWPGDGLYNLVRNDADGTEHQQYVSVFDSHITAYDTLPDGLGQAYMHDSFAGLQLSSSESGGSSMLVMRNDGSFEITQFVDSSTRVAYNERRVADGAWSLGLNAADGSSQSITLDPSPIVSFPVFSESSEDAASGRRTNFELSPGGAHSSFDATVAHVATSSDAAGNQAITLSMQDGSGGASLVRNAAPEPGDPLAFFGDFRPGGPRHQLTQSADGRWTLDQGYGPGKVSSVLSSTGERRFVLNSEAGTTVTLASQVFPGNPTLQLTARALDGGGLHQGTLTEFGGPNSVGVSVFGSSVEVSYREISPDHEVPYAVSWAGLDGSEVFASINLDGSGFGQSLSADGSTWAASFFLDGSVIANWAAADGSFGDESYSASTGVWISSYQDADGTFGSATLSGDGNLLAERRDADGGYALYSIGASGAIYLERHNADGTRLVKALGADRSLSSTFGDAGGEIETQSYDPATGEYQRDYQYSDQHRGTIARGTDGSLHSDLYLADGTHSVVDISATGDTHSEYYGADGALELGEGATTGADGSYGIRGSVSGASITQLFDADGVLLSTSWEREDGSSGHATFNPDDTVATSEWTRVFEDGTYTVYAKSEAGEVQMDYFAADDTLLGSYWASPDGTYGEDSFAEDDSSYSVVYDPLEDEWSVTLVDADGVIEEFVYGAFGNLNQANVSGGEGDDVLRALDGQGNTLVGGPGNDTLIGASGDDTYVFNQGDGVDSIFDGVGGNSIEFGDGITPEMLSLELGSLLIRVGDSGDAIHLQNFDQADAEAGAGVGTFRFAGGATLSYAELIGRGFDISGTPGDDAIDGTSVSDRIDGGAGDDVLRGGAGNDRYAFAPGDGNDVIADFDTSEEGNFDALVMGTGISAQDVEVSRSDEGDIVLRLDESNSVTVRWDRDLGAVMEQVSFADGTTWSDAQLEELAGDGGGNSAPILAHEIDDHEATEDEAFSVTFAEDTFADVDADDELTYTAGPLPDWLTFDSASRTFSGTPQNADVGALEVQVTATDEAGESASDAFEITVVNTNDAPTVAQALSDQTATEDVPYTYIVPEETFADVDASDYLTWSAARSGGAVLPDWLSFDAPTRTFTGTPANGDVGGVGLEVTVRDGAGATASSTFELGVANVNDAPVVLTPLGERSFEAGARFSFNVPAGSFADPDAGDRLALSARLFGGGALPAWLEFDAANGTFSGKTDKKENGISHVVVTATDSAGASASSDFGLVIRAKANSKVIGDKGDDVIYGGTGNEVLVGQGGNDALFGNVGSDLLMAGKGNDVLQGGAGNDVLHGGKGQNLLDGGAGADLIFGGQGSGLIIGGTGNDVIHTGSGSDVIAFNSGDGWDTVYADRGRDNTLSFGGGISSGDLKLLRQKDDLIVSAGGNDRVVLKDWYEGRKSVSTLQIIAGDEVQTYDFQGLVRAYDRADRCSPGVTSWALTNALLQFHLATSDDFALGGDLAYWYARNRGLAGISLSAAQQILGNPNFGEDAQRLKPFSGLQEGFVKLS